MRRLFIGVGAFAVAIATTLVAAASVGAPEIDRANATIDLRARDIKMVDCRGEDAPDRYFTIASVWNGPETETTPGFTDYNLTGKLTYRARITVNRATSRGVMIGIATLTNTPAGATPQKVYTGSLKLILQQVDQPNGARWAGRGFLDAATYSKDTSGKLVRDGGSILANVEAQFTSPSGGLGFAAIRAQFGDTSVPPQPVVQDYSVTTNNLTCV